MPDVWSSLADADTRVQEQLANVLEVAANDPSMQATLASFLTEIELPERSRALEIGCGTGRVVRALAALPNVAEIIGVDPAPLLIEKARTLSASLTNATFEEMDGRALSFEGEAFDVVVLYRTLLHVEGPEQVLAEAYRVLRPNGLLAVLDADGETITVSTGDYDPLQNCIEALKASSLNEPWIVRRLPNLLPAAGFPTFSISSYGTIMTSDPGIILSQIDRGADALLAWGRIGPELADALKREARNRADVGRFFAFFSEASFLARKN
jgi:arsenite methyltransferase